MGYWLTTVLVVLIAWPVAALAFGLALGRAIAACGSHDAPPH